MFPGPAARGTIANICFYSLQTLLLVNNLLLFCCLTRFPFIFDPWCLNEDAEPRCATDVQALTSEGEGILASLSPAFKRYNETQLATVKLPGSSQEVGFANEHSPLPLTRCFWEGHC